MRRDVFCSTGFTMPHASVLFVLNFCSNTLGAVSPVFIFVYFRVSPRYLVFLIAAKLLQLLRHCVLEADVHIGNSRTEDVSMSPSLYQHPWACGESLK